MSHDDDGKNDGIDIHVIACLRGSLTNGDQNRVFGVRWAARPDFGFPRFGFELFRVVGGGAPTSIGEFILPPSETWNEFKEEAERRRPVMGPYFRDILPENLEYLLPIIGMADPRPRLSARPKLVFSVVDVFGPLHAGDAALAWVFWPNGSVPPLEDLMDDPRARDALVSYYRARCVAYLLTLALRFEYAVLFGLATDDLAPRGNEDVGYRIRAQWEDSEKQYTSTTDLDLPRPSCEPPPPDVVTATRIPGNVAHRAFADWSDWVPPPELMPKDPDGVPLPASGLVPRVPAAFTGLSWSAPVPSPRLIGYGPALYLVSRFDFGADTAALPDTPPIPPDAKFVPLFDGEPLIRPTAEPHTVDLPGMNWPPLEGHYVYEVKGVSLLGFVSKTGTRASVRHHDDLSPMPPRVRLIGNHGLTAGPTGVVTTEIDIDWDAREDFVSPDVVDFRVGASFTPLNFVSVQVTALLSADPLVCTIQVADLAGVPNKYAGRRLLLPNGEFVIVKHNEGAPATMTVRRCAGRAPAIDAMGIIFTPGVPTKVSRVTRLSREPAIATRVERLVSEDPVGVSLDPPPDVAIVSGRLYLHLLRASVDVAVRSGDKFYLIAPEWESPGYAMWKNWLSLPDPAAAIAGSPVLLFPTHHISATVSVPTEFVAGTLTLDVTAADGTSYVDSPTLPVSDLALVDLKGNESTPAQVVASVRRMTPPDAPATEVFDPDVRLWAMSAASYAEAARFEVTWAPVPGAIRYEVWRALEGILVGVTPATTDTDLRVLAAGQPGAFELRSGDIYATHYLDEIPGRAPTRVVYLVRAVSAAGVAGLFSGVIGPVHVPDVRPPPAPNLVRVVTPPPEEMDRVIVVEWTQAALESDLRFEVESREPNTASTFTTVGEVASGTAPVNGHFRFVHFDRIPGLHYEYRVIAVREALDPTDPSASARRAIRSLPSETRTGVAISASPLAPPVEVTATHDIDTSSIHVAWTNEDSYDILLVYRRAPGRFGFERIVELAGMATSYDDRDITAGTWAYQIRARMASREARSTIVEEVVS